MSLPTALQRYWEHRTLKRRSMAWVTVAPEGTIAGLGGELSRYGLGAAAVGDDAELALPFLVGATPDAGRALVLPFVELTGVSPAEVHIGADGRQRHVLLLDASRDFAAVRDAQQRRNESSLGMRTELEEDAARFADALEVLVLRRVEDTSFAPFARVPAWATDLCEVNEAFVLPEVFPFLESFLPDACAVWDGDAKGRVRSGPWTREGPFGTEVHLEAVAMFLPVVGPVLIVELLGDRYWERQRALQLARERLLALDELRREQDSRTVLIHAIVHDLKGPLTGIKGAVDLLGDTPGLSADAASLLETAARGCRKQQGMIQDIAAVFRDSDPAQQTSAQDQLALVSCAREVVAYMRPGFESIERDVRVVVDAAAESALVRGTGRRIERVFANLLENARRHTPRHGRVTVRITHNGDHIRAAVENEGSPVPDELRAHLFDRFVSGSRGGTSGIGLYYCRITVERWGGSIAYEPLEDGGAIFVFNLPLA